jgi:hypothetical protein
LSDPLYPEPTLIKVDSTSLVNKFKEPQKFPGTRDAIKTYEAAIQYIVSQVGQEYTKQMQQEESKGANGPSNSKHNATAFLSSQQAEMLAESRRDKFLAEFTQSHKYVEIRSKL